MTADPKISVVIISKNESRNIEECLKSVLWADEIVVVDSGSSDGTQEIVLKYTNRLYFVEWLGFGPQKQKAVDLAGNDWIFNIDCDERVTPELAREILNIAGTEPSCYAYTVPRRTFIANKEIRHSGWYPDRTIRLFHRRHARFSDSIVHERVEAEGAVGACASDMLHYSFRNFSEIIDKLNKYAMLSAEQMAVAGKRCSFIDLLLRPPAAFIKIYLLRAGFLDGIEGLGIAVLTATQTFLKYLMLREHNLKKHPSNRNES
ncbi:MAG: glycosyltransferase family 2 protein [Deltaproteobacteria bacterium]|nr:glycosyltransferase family 2 protein [Deltaproteobacteria bacterium]